MTNTCHQSGRRDHDELEDIALAALTAAQLLMENGARSKVARAGAEMVAHGLGARRAYTRMGFASSSITVGSDAHAITRMTHVGRHGVNLRLEHAVRALCCQISEGGWTAERALSELRQLESSASHHHIVFVSLAVGLACTAFSRLLGADLLAVLPVLCAGCFGQYMRHFCMRRGINAFVVTALIAFLAAVMGGLGGQVLGSATVETAMFASVLLLVPGVPLLNGQTDIMEGHPTLGSARCITAFMILIFITVGIWSAQAVLSLGVGPAFPGAIPWWEQSLYGAIAATGFGILFNFSWVTVGWAAFAGALGLAVRANGVELGLSFASASFIAASVVAGAVWVMTSAPDRFTQTGTVLGVAGCIPMIPGSAASHSIMGLFALTAPDVSAPGQLLLTSVGSGLQAIFVIVAIGAGLTIVGSLLRSQTHDFRTRRRL